MKIKGGRELHALLQQLPVQVETKIMRNAMARGVKVIQAEAKRLAPTESGALDAAIKTTRDTKKGRVVAKVKVLGEHSYLARFMEYGVLPHVISVRDGEGSLKIGKSFVGAEVMHPGHASRPFLRPAFDSKAAEAVNVIGEYIASYLKFGTIQAPTVSVDGEDV